MLLPEALRLADRDRHVFGYGYFLPWKDMLAGALREQHAEVTCFEARNNVAILLAAGRVARHLRKWRADILHCHLPISGAAGRVAGRLARLPVVYTEHNTMHRYNPVTRRINLMTWRWQERVIAVSSDVAESIRAHTRSRVPIDVILNGVDVDRFDRARVGALAIRRELAIPEAAPVVGTVAVFREQKRLGHWLEAARLVHEEQPGTHFLIVGDGPQRRNLHEQARELGLGAAVHWAGLCKDVRPYMAAMDVYAMSSAFEGLPVALLEAMAMRCAAVVTAVGGIPELISDGENGMLVEPYRPRELAGRILSLLSRRDDLTRLAAAGRSTVERRFSMRQMVAETEAVYERVLEVNGDAL